MPDKSGFIDKRIIARFADQVIFLSKDIGAVDSLRPVFRGDFLDRYRDGTFGTAGDGYNFARDGLGQSLLLGLGSARVSFNDDVRHGFLPNDLIDGFVNRSRSGLQVSRNTAAVVPKAATRHEAHRRYLPAYG